MVLESYGKINDSSLNLRNVDIPKPGKHELLVKVNFSGVCHTDLHVIEKELPMEKLPIVPGHQIAGIVAELGSQVRNFEKGDRVGVTWLNSTCGKCEFCMSGKENLCENARFTGYSVNGGFAEYLLVDNDFAFKIPDEFDDEHAAPLFCAGIIGYRAFKLANLQKNQTLAIFGFGASGHIIAQIAEYFENELLVFTRSKEHQKLAKKYGAVWTGEPYEEPIEKADAVIITAPVGELVIEALNNTKRGGRVAIQDIYMSNIPPIDYNKLLYYERWIGSVTNYTRKDAKEFLHLASEIPIKTQIKRFRLEDANKALVMLKSGRIEGAGVLKI